MSTPPPVAASPVDRALLVTGGVGIAVFTALILASAWVYDAVVDADGVSGLDRPVLDWALGVRTPAAEYWVTAC